MVTPTDTIATLLARIRAEYREMPGLMLTKPQMQRLWGLDAVTCDALVAARVLYRTNAGRYIAMLADSARA